VIDKEDIMRSLRERRESAILVVNLASDWDISFRSVWKWDQNFNEENFPPEPRGKFRRAFERRFSHAISGVEALQRAELDGQVLALPLATGRYFRARQGLRSAPPVVGCGQWEDKDGCIWVPVFRRYNWRLRVSLYRLAAEFGPEYIWLFSSKLRRVL
jgi:hypothetical protein